MPRATHDKPGIAAAASDDTPRTVARPLDDTVRIVRQFVAAGIEEERWDLEAVAAYMTERGCKMNRPYLSAMLGGTDGKPITVRHLAALPPGVLRRFSKKIAQHCGQIVVDPLSPTESGAAVEQFIAGLFALLTRPTMAKADLDASTPAKVVNR